MAVPEAVPVQEAQAAIPAVTASDPAALAAHENMAALAELRIIAPTARVATVISAQAAPAVPANRARAQSADLRVVVGAVATTVAAAAEAAVFITSLATVTVVPVQGAAEAPRSLKPVPCM